MTATSCRESVGSKNTTCIERFGRIREDICWIKIDVSHGLGVMDIRLVEKYWVHGGSGNGFFEFIEYDVDNAENNIQGSSCGVFSCELDFRSWCFAGGECCGCTPAQI